MIKLYDTHAHLDHLEDVDEKLAAAAQAGVQGVIAAGIDLNSSRINLKIKKRCKAPKIFLAFGIHPSNIVAQEIDATIQWIRENINEAVAIGEIGLDYWYPWVKKSKEKKQEQQEVFVRQLELSKEFDLPVVIHSRGAWQDCFLLAQQAGIKRAVFHWYSGPIDVLDNILSAGYYISGTPALFYSPQSQEAMKRAQAEQTLIETDTPVFYRIGENGFKAEPKDVFQTLEFYAKLKDIEPERAAEILNRNAKRVFNLDV